MKISDVLRSLVDIVDKNSTDETEVIGQDDTSVFSGQLKPVVLPDVKSATRVKTEEKTASGNDKEPEDLFISPLQMKMELLKKASGVQNIYDDGAPEQQEEERIEKEGMWTGSDHQYDFVGAQTGAVESSTKGESKAETPDFGKAKDKAEDKDEETDTETAEDDDKEEKKEKETATESFRRTLDMLALVESWDDDEDDDVRKADDELRKMGKKIEPAKINTDKDKIKKSKDDEEDLDEAKAPSMNRWGKKAVSEEKSDKDYDCDGEVESEKDEVWGSRMRAAKKAGKMDEGCDDEEQLDELGKGTLGNYIKKSADELPRHSQNWLGKALGPSDRAHDSKHPQTGESPIEWDHRKVKNRGAGIHRATDRLAAGYPGKHDKWGPANLDALDEECSDMQDWGEEKLDELSLGTLGSYKDKASKDRDRSAKLATSAAQRGRGSDTAQFMKHSERFGKRDAGIKRADSHAEKKIGQLDELSRDTLKSYVKKANQDSWFQGRNFEKAADKGDQEGKKTANRKSWNRHLGIDRAMDQLEESDLYRIVDLANYKLEEAAKEKKVDKESKAADNLVIFDELTSDHPTE